MINKIIKSQMLYHLNRAFKKWGIEGTEQKLKEIYSQIPTLQERYLEVYYKQLKGE